MPSSYTSLLRFELPVQGELSGTWGNVVNTAITTPVSEAIAGTTSISVGATDYTLTNGDGASANEARKMFITATGSPGATRSVICPSASKLYVFFNNTSDGSALIFRTSGSGVTVPSGQRRLLYCDGTNVVEAVNGFGSLTLGTALAATSGGTGQSSYAIGDLLYASSTTALSKLAAVAIGNVLRAKGVGVAPAWEPVALATDVSGVLPIANGGTGQTTANAALNALLPNQATNNGKYLQTDGTNATWTTVAIPDVLATIAAASLGAIGTYAFMNTVPLAAYTEGTLVPGADLRYSGIYIDGSGNSGPTSGAAPTGTWRAMGRTQSSSANSSLTLFLRQA